MIDHLSMIPALFGSSAWVLSGDHTENGAPILAADLHLAPTAPPLGHVAHRRGGELDVGGAMVPGIPVVWAGRTREVAWSATPAQAVTANLFEESVRARPVDPLYHDGQAWRKLAERAESIAVRMPGGELREEERRAIQLDGQEGRARLTQGKKKKKDIVSR